MTFILTIFITNTDVTVNTIVPNAEIKILLFRFILSAKTPVNTFRIETKKLTPKNKIAISEYSSNV